MPSWVTIIDTMVKIQNLLHGVVAAMQCPAPGATEREGAKVNPILGIGN